MIQTFIDPVINITIFILIRVVFMLNSFIVTLKIFIAGNAPGIPSPCPESALIYKRAGYDMLITMTGLEWYGTNGPLIKFHIFLF